MTHHSFGTRYSTIKSQNPIHRSTPEMIATSASHTAAGSKYRLLELYRRTFGGALLVTHSALTMSPMRKMTHSSIGHRMVGSIRCGDKPQV